MRSSLFRRITRYHVSTALDPRENRLTEATAAALEHVDDLAARFVRDLVEQDAQQLAAPAQNTHLQMRANLDFEIESVAVNTQVGTRSGGWVDLEVVLRPAPGSGRTGLLVWVEVKHGADLHGDQLTVYLSDIEARYPGEELERRVVLLAPRDFKPAVAVPPRILRAGWQGLSRTFAGVARSVAAPEQRWLLDEYIRYLEEEGLSDPKALTATTALALMEQWNAVTAVAGICEHADAYIEKHWGPRTDYEKLRSADRRPAYGLDYWSSYETSRKASPPRTGWTNMWFEWGLRDAESLEYFDDEPRGSYAFIAGSSAFASDNPLKRAGNEAWSGRLAAKSFHHVWLANYKNVRLRYPDELLVETTLEQQGIALGRWVVDAFEALAEDAPDA